jgi:DNA-binding NarL/FixJ family response regulator
MSPRDYSLRLGSDTSVSHVSAIPGDVPGREAIPPILQLVARELSPLAATLFILDDDGEIRFSAVHGTHLAPADLAKQLRTWKDRLRGIDPLAPPKITSVDGRIATLRDVGGAQHAVLDNERLRTTYDEIGAINDVRLLIRDGGRPVAGVTLWRSVKGDDWTSAQLRVLEALQPLIEMAYLSAARATATIDARLPASLTRRQRQVARLLVGGATNSEIARALYVSPDTAKSHTRAVLGKLGVASRREMVMRFTQESAEDTPAPARARHLETLRLKGDDPPQRLLVPALDWAAQRIGAAIGGCALFSARLELIAQASATTGVGELDLEQVARVHQLVFPPSQPVEIARQIEADRAQSPVVQLDVSGPEPADDRLGDLAASLGVTSPLLMVLRSQGSLAGLIWLSRDAESATGQAESARALRGLHPLLQLACPTPSDSHRQISAKELADWGLTEREAAVARLALAGEGNAAIAERLEITESTVKNHMTQVLTKCGVRSRTQLIALFALEPRGSLSITD